MIFPEYQAHGVQHGKRGGKQYQGYFVVQLWVQPRVFIGGEVHLLEFENFNFQQKPENLGYFVKSASYLDNCSLDFYKTHTKHAPIRCSDVPFVKIQKY